MGRMQEKTHDGIVRHRCFLDVERIATAASSFGVGIAEMESALINAFVIIQRRAVQEKFALFVDDDGDAELIGLRIVSRIELVIDLQAVVQAAAAAADHSDAQHGISRKLLFFDRSFNFTGRFFSHRQRHLFLHLFKI